MSLQEQLRLQLLAKLRDQSVCFGDFTLSSGAKSKYYVNCKKTTLDPECAWLVGKVFCQTIRAEAKRRGVRIDSIGGLTMGADPIALATGMVSALSKKKPRFQTFTVRKAPKAHGQGKQIEGIFKRGDHVVVIDDVVTRGDSTLQAIDAIKLEGGQIEFVVVLVDREEGGREKIENTGIKVISVFTRNELLNPKVEAGDNVEVRKPENLVVA